MPSRKQSAKPNLKNVSAGLLLYRCRDDVLEVFLAHPGGPFWAKKDAGAWTIPKGLVETGEEPLSAAVREFEEETGIKPAGPYKALGTVRQKAGKVIHAWAVEGDADPRRVRSNVVRMKTGAGWRQFPEIDRCDWFTPEVARQKLNPGQVPLVDRLIALIQGSGGTSS